MRNMEPSPTVVNQPGGFPFSSMTTDDDAHNRSLRS